MNMHAAFEFIARNTTISRPRTLRVIIVHELYKALARAPHHLEAFGVHSFNLEALRIEHRKLIPDEPGVIDHAQLAHFLVTVGRLSPVAACEFLDAWTAWEASQGLISPVCVQLSEASSRAYLEHLDDLDREEKQRQRLTLMNYANTISTNGHEEERAAGEENHSGRDQT